MTFPEFLAEHFPTQAPKPNDIARPWVGYLANLYTAATGETMTADDARWGCEESGYEVSQPLVLRVALVSEKELHRCDRKFSAQMLANYKAGGGV